MWCKTAGIWAERRRNVVQSCRMNCAVSLWLSLNWLIYFVLSCRFDKMTGGPLLHDVVVLTWPPHRRGSKQQKQILSTFGWLPKTYLTQPQKTTKKRPLVEKTLLLEMGLWGWKVHLEVDLSSEPLMAASVEWRRNDKKKKRLQLQRAPRQLATAWRLSPASDVVKLTFALRCWQEEPSLSHGNKENTASHPSLLCFPSTREENCREVQIKCQYGDTEMSSLLIINSLWLSFCCIIKRV